jgi:hypothetical protein
MCFKNLKKEKMDAAFLFMETNVDCTKRRIEKRMQRNLFSSIGTAVSKRRFLLRWTQLVCWTGA